MKERLDSIDERVAHVEQQLSALGATIRERQDTATLQRTELVAMIAKLDDKIELLIVAHNLGIGARTAMRTMAWLTGSAIAAVAGLAAIWNFFAGGKPH